MAEIDELVEEVKVMTGSDGCALTTSIKQTEAKCREIGRSSVASPVAIV